MDFCWHECTYIGCHVVNARWTNGCVCKCSLSVRAATRVPADDEQPLHSQDCFHLHKPADHFPHISVASSGHLPSTVPSLCDAKRSLYVIDNGRPTYLLRGATYGIVGWFAGRTWRGKITVSGVPNRPKLLCNVYGTYIVWNCGRGSRVGDPGHRCEGDVVRNSFYC